MIDTIQTQASSSDVLAKTEVGDGPASTTTALYIPGKIVSSFEQIQPNLRWHKGRLQQCWAIFGVGTSGAVEDSRYEWRDVPEED